MGLFKRKDHGDVAPFTGWEITTTMSDGSTAELRGSVYVDGGYAEWMRYIDAIADGLRAAGFDAEVVIKREQVERR